VLGLLLFYLLLEGKDVYHSLNPCFAILRRALSIANLVLLVLGRIVRLLVVEVSNFRQPQLFSQLCTMVLLALNQQT